MGLFENFKQNHLPDKPLNYLWEMRLTDSEYDELKANLISQSTITRFSNRFILVCKECALFFAEYWRREYNGDYHSKIDVFNALGADCRSDAAVNEFYEAAKRGFIQLQLELYQGERGKEYLDSMLYQGGLPMKLVTANIHNSVWDRFTRGLVNRRINFEELNLGIVASRSKCLKAYCKQMIEGINKAQYLSMPFYCQDATNPWYIYLKELKRQETEKKRMLRPFSLSWEFEVDNVDKKITAKYVVKGLQRLPEVFLKEQNLLAANFFSVHVKKNGHHIDTFDYVNNFCRYAVVSKHPYKCGDFISLYLEDQNEPHIGDELDMSVPHLLFKNSNGKYELGNRLGSSESLILIPNGWNLNQENDFAVYDYSWDDQTFKGVIIDEDFEDEITINGKEGNIVFGMNSTLYWTDIQSRPLYQPNIVESVYDAGNSSFMLFYDKNDCTHHERTDVEFRNKWQSKWTDTPSYGDIYVRAKSNDGKFVTPMRFINVGNKLSIDFIKADNNTCRIRVLWPYGQVTTNEGEKKANDIWEICKDNCEDPRRISFTFIPNENSNNQFTLTVKAPFKDFSIINIYDEKTQNNSWIPYADIDKYQYHLIGQNVEYTYGNKTRILRWVDDELCIFEQDRKIKTIPYEGSLLSLFNSREELRSMLEYTSKNMIYAEVNVQFILNNGTIFSFGIKDSPYRPWQQEDGSIIVTGKDYQTIKFTGVMKLIKLDNPMMDALEMQFDENLGKYQLPEEIRAWGKTLLIGRTRGRICPTLVDLTQDMNHEYRISSRETAIVTIKENLEKSKIDDEQWNRILGWNERAQKENIPASSLLELDCVAKDSKVLLCLAFVLFAKCMDNQKDLLFEQFKSFSYDLAFQWYWLRPHLNNTLNLIVPFINGPTTPTMQTIYINWALKQETTRQKEYINAINTDRYHYLFLECLKDVVCEFMDWMKNLFVSSMTENYQQANDEITNDIAQSIAYDTLTIRTLQDELYVDFNQDNLDEESMRFFNNYQERNKTTNEQWLYQRVNVVANHLLGKLNLFSTSDEIRRSIIFCSKSSNRLFLIALNNKLLN